jgi:Fe-S-cluster containining protein
MESVSERTAFVKTAKELGLLLREASLDHPSFDQRLQPCLLHECRATCCHDGVLLSTEEADRLRELMTEHRARLGSYGVDVDGDSIVLDAKRGSWRTKVGPSSAEERAEDFPAHFPKTRCVFLDAGHRCAWQRLAGDLGKDAWFFKPIGCWMHPLTVRLEAGRPVLRLPTAASDPQSTEGRPGFASSTPCGRSCLLGEPATEVLAEEIGMLSVISGRDLNAELNAPTADGFGGSETLETPA